VVSQSRVSPPRTARTQIDAQINFIAKADGFPDAPVVLPGRKWQPFGGLSINRPRVQDHLREMYNEVIQHYDLFW
jgi:hypothetical protein